MCQSMWGTNWGEREQLLKNLNYLIFKVWSIKKISQEYNLNKKVFKIYINKDSLMQM